MENFQATCLVFLVIEDIQAYLPIFETGKMYNFTSTCTVCKGCKNVISLFLEHCILYKCYLCLFTYIFSIIRLIKKLVSIILKVICNINYLGKSVILLYFNLYSTYKKNTYFVEVASFQMFFFFQILIVIIS